MLPLFCLSTVLGPMLIGKALQLHGMPLLHAIGDRCRWCVRMPDCLPPRVNALLHRCC